MYISIENKKNNNSWQYFEIFCLLCFLLWPWIEVVSKWIREDCSIIFDKIVSMIICFLWSSSRVFSHCFGLISSTLIICPWKCLTEQKSVICHAFHWTIHLISNQSSCKIPQLLCKNTLSSEKSLLWCNSHSQFKWEQLESNVGAMYKNNIDNIALALGLCRISMYWTLDRCRGNIVIQHYCRGNVGLCLFQYRRNIQSKLDPTWNTTSGRLYPGLHLQCCAEVGMQCCPTWIATLPRCPWDVAVLGGLM